LAKSEARGAYSGGAYKKKRVKKFATTTEEIRRILRLVANFTGKKICNNTEKLR
jgi:hypothetical protein